MKTVWPDTFVEEANLSRNIFMLRKALGETAQDHRYIVTVPGQGYRFAENVRLVPEHELSMVAANHSKVQIEVEQTRPWGWISVVVILLVAVAAGTFRLFFHRTTVLSEKDTVVLADFANSTGDPVFDGTLRQGMAVQLEQSPFLSFISEERIQHTLHLMGRPARLTPELAREICERTGAAAELEGSIAPLGNQYVLGLRAKNCRTGDVLDDEQVQARRKEDVRDALSQIASKFRTRVGESLSTIEKHDTPLAEATTPSIEALKLYSTALEVGLSADNAGAVPLLQRAIEIDPKFAMAHAFLGRVYADMSESVLSAQSTSKAYELRDRASDRERFFIMLSFDLQVTGNLEKAQRTGELWAQTYPRDRDAHGLSSWIYQQLGKYERSAEEAQRAIEADPNFPPGPANLAWTYIFLDRLGDAQDTLERAAEHKLEAPDLLVLPYFMAFLHGDEAEMKRTAALGKRNPIAEDWISNAEASVAAHAGHFQQARRMSRRAVDLARQAHQLERVAMYEVGAAVREAFFGNATEARRSAIAALEVSRARDVEYGAAFALARSGESTRSQALANDLEKRFPEDTLVRFTYLPTIRALLALNHGAASNAIERLQGASPYDLVIPGTWFGFFGLLYPA